ncbi:hypothetical protein E4K72_05960 [Oxalobacteraceae bacterium OM1]|nr:hypothetical protein E4K72_05960 [Oxalobacteraceae bacterium OM1]
MAFYGDTDRVKPSTRPRKYRRRWRPGDTPDYPGIYKCQRCGFEDVFNRACETVPPCSMCQEQTTDWKLLVRAVDY